MQLSNHFEIADFIERISSKPVDKNLIEDYFYGCHALLQVCLVKDLIEGNIDCNVPDKNLERKYLTLPVKTMPPLIVQNHTIFDGNHRFRVLKKLGIIIFPIYKIRK